MPGPKKVKQARAVGPVLKKFLFVLLGLFALLIVNSLYLLSITIAGVEYQNWLYLVMFLAHLVLGLIIVVPFIVFSYGHLKNTYLRKNRRAVKVGYVLLVCSTLLLITGFVLMRVDIFGIRFEINNPSLRSTAYFMHVASPLVIIWLYILHRLAGPKIRWRVGYSWLGVTLIFVVLMTVFHFQDPRSWNKVGPASGQKYFFPSLARTTDGAFIPEKVMKNDNYCQECHHNIHEDWQDSAHKFSSFNNPVYEFSVKNTRSFAMKRDGNVQASRFCAGCHDPVPFFSGAFDDPRYDDPAYDLSKDRLAQAGITCTSCHAISHINSPKGNADYTIDEPVQYPFTFSDNYFLKWVNRQLIKAKPEFHKATYLKPLHKSPEFCGSCHKVHLPEELNHYKWLRGQNHFDSFWLSGVSGQGIGSFYYPPKAKPNCSACHMPPVKVDDRPNFGAKDLDGTGILRTSNHMFPAANTAMPHLLSEQFFDATKTIKAHQQFLDGALRVDIFGLKEDGRIDGKLTAPIRPIRPALVPGKSYLLETVIRTLKLGHLFTQGTADSNQIWLELIVEQDSKVIGHSGGVNDLQAVDPWSHFVNAFIIDREGHKVDRRNAEDIFVALYNHQIPPGAADVVHYRFTLPEDSQGDVTIRARLHYRKFDNTIMGMTMKDPNYHNDLPITLLAEDKIVLKLQDSETSSGESPYALWERWNDYGIGLFRKGGRGELIQARQAFQKVQDLGKPDGPLNLARTYIREGLIQNDAPKALALADQMGANQWSLLWFGSQVASGNGDYDQAEANLRDILKGGFKQAAGRGFDFSKDYRVLNAMGDVLFQKALRKRGDERKAILEESGNYFQKALEYDPENRTAHWGLRQVYRNLGDIKKAEKHSALYARYKPDDNARDRAVREARKRYPAANHAAESVVVYDTQRKDAVDFMHIVDQQVGDK